MKGVRDLEEGIKGNQLMEAYPHPISKNCLPHIDVFMDNGYTKEEMKMINETKKILKDDSIKVTATCVRVPIFDSHSESINVEFEKPYELSDVFTLFNEMDGIIVQDDPTNNLYLLLIQQRDLMKCSLVVFAAMSL